mmetsp:Transcript_50573/g.123318  ORF Transcript_50573/g.123318 Transcript_50573/m.123318 type:complete len:287 (-) Transcript_50573:2-862(-)|eukprot:CAMPEP_0206227872 /NCGR_PEP_ID=MMETSP0047_2-20121206/8861_1 /ASSEMBLY_ACC=CAM_ASM_000192 /TAXON_ID=195065 /ORGANISM="Chroomonas mesostigmatica_cf, Strain CCMP1168" /LENGTH=286 /DNA_ID=CAMNT_0053651065 /DNA_START=103 /DNA_END=963 /DNA_ORIENTATION=+
MKVLLVRHAQSANNIVQAQVHTKLASGAMNAAQAQTEWLANRLDDPELSSDGLLQIQALTAYGEKLKKKNPSTNIKIYSSPMTRACQTAQAVKQGVGADAVHLDPDLCEVGGIYSAQQINGTFQKVVGKCPDAQTLCRKFSGFQPGKCPASGPWDGGAGHEASNLSVARAQKVSEWLKYKAEAEVGPNGIIIIVSHADFIALLIASLCNVQVNSKAAELNPDMDMSSHGVSEGTLDDEIEAHCNSVYIRFRVSLACMTMIELQGGKATVLWMNKKKHLKDKNCVVM